MRRLLALMICAVSLAAAAQITYPYNPDGNADTSIGVTDMQDLLSTYGQPFFPSEILVEGQTLTSVLMDLQHSIDSLSALSGGGGGSVLDMPIGTILPVASEAVPEGWVLCDGRELAIEDYQGLYDLIGTTYGAGDSAFWAQVFFPATTFNIPDLRGRTIIGANDMGGEQSDVLTIHQASAGQVGGEELHQLTEEEMPSHSHDLPKQESSSCCGNGFYYRTNVSYAVEPYPVSEAGGDQPHNNMQPYMALNYMMKVQAAEDVVAELTGQIAALESQVEELSNTPGFPFAEVQIIDCGNPSNCELQCLSYGENLSFGYNSMYGEVNCNEYPWDDPSWLRFEIHAPWVSSVEDVRFIYNSATGSQPRGFGTWNITAGGIGTDRITFTVYIDLSSVSSYEGVPDDLQQEAIVAARPQTNLYTSYSHQYMSVLIGGVWYDTGITWK